MELQVFCKCSQFQGHFSVYDPAVREQPYLAELLIRKVSFLTFGKFIEQKKKLQFAYVEKKINNWMRTDI